MIQTLFKIAASVVSFYGTLCFIRIILTWFPGANYSGIGSFFAQLCDPYLNAFRRIPLRLGMMDFTPVLALGILTLISSVLNNIAFSGVICVSDILSYIISLIWSLFSTFCFVLLLLLIVRIVVSVFSKTSNNYGSPWQRFDDSIRPIVFKISSVFTSGRPISFQSALIIDAITVGVLLIAGRILLTQLIRLVQLIPF